MSTLKTDNIVGSGSANEVTFVNNKFTASASGSVTLPGENTATTNLQQGLVKAWADFQTASGNSYNGSFNFSTITDVDTGDVYLNFSNNMNDVHYSGWAGGAAITIAHFDDQATNRQRHTSYSTTSSTDAADGSHRFVGVTGDLA